MKFISKSVAETQKIAAEMMQKLTKKNPPSDPPFKKGGLGGFLIGLTGDLGAGKTTFVQGLAKGAGIDPDYYVNSPTFTLINEYEGKGLRIIHVDLYRIERAIEGSTLALEEYFQPGNIIVVEWPERIPDLESQLDFLIRLRAISDKEREIEIISL